MPQSRKQKSDGHHGSDGPRRADGYHRSNSPSPRLVAAQIVDEVIEGHALFDDVLAGHPGFAAATPEDRRLIYHLAAGTIKYKRRLDRIARHFLKTKFDRLPANIRAALRVGLFQLSVSDKIPAYAAVNETVKVARQLGHQGTASLVNAVLRRFTTKDVVVTFPSRETDFASFLAEWFSYPDWLISEFINLAGEDGAERLCRWGNGEPIFFLRANHLNRDGSRLQVLAGEEDVKLEPFATVPGYYRWLGAGGPSAKSIILQKGLASVQNPAAGLVVNLLDPQPGEKIADLFAAPGGKATAIAERQNDTGQVLAVDKNRRRLARVFENKARLGLSSILPIHGDVLRLAGHQVDRVLADVPCSALGTLSKNPDVRWQKNPADVSRLAGEQLEYLTAASRQLREGGVLVYATCTFTAQENQDVVKEFLRQNPDFATESADRFVPAQFVESSGFLRTLPGESGLDCVFAARMKKGRGREHKR